MQSYSLFPETFAHIRGAYIHNAGVWILTSNEQLSSNFHSPRKHPIFDTAVLESHPKEPYTKHGDVRHNKRATYHPKAHCTEGSTGPGRTP